MSVNLRPLSLGEIFDRTAELYRKNFVLFAGLSGVYAGAIMILALLQILTISALNARTVDVARSGMVLVFFTVELCAMFVLIGVSMAANSRAVAWVNLGEPATILGAYKSILPNTGRYVWLMFVAGFRIGVPLTGFIVVLSIGAVFVGVAGRSAGQAGPAILGGFFVFVGFVAAMVFACWMSIRYSLAVPACVVEDLKASEAIERSIELSKGSRGRIFLLFLLTAVIAIALVLITQFPILIAAFMHPRQPLSLATQALQQFLSFITSTLIGPIYAIGLTLFYYDQRIRKEGFDIVWMMQAAGLTALAASTGDGVPSAADGTETAQA